MPAGQAAVSVASAPASALVPASSGEPLELLLLLVVLLDVVVLLEVAPASSDVAPASSDVAPASSDVAGAPSPASSDVAPASSDELLDVLALVVVVVVPRDVDTPDVVLEELPGWVLDVWFVVLLFDVVDVAGMVKLPVPVLPPVPSLPLEQAAMNAAIPPTAQSERRFIRA
jgi:hypothetical protein